MMLLVRLMGLLDLVACVLILLYQLNVIGYFTLFPFVLYLLIKGWMFRSDLASLVDIGIGIYLLLIWFFSPWIITILVILYLLQKAVMSLFM